MGLYTFTTRCEEDRSIELGDGTKKIIYNCCYGGDDIPEDLRQFYRYIETGKAENEMTEHLNDAVFRARREGELRSSYLKEMDWKLFSMVSGIIQEISTDFLLTECQLLKTSIK